MTRFIILSAADGAGTAGTGPTGRAFPAALRLICETLSPAEWRALRRDPATLAIARDIPTRIVAPEPLDDVRDDDAVPGWGIDAIGAGASGFSGAGVRVAVLDTGIDAGHPAFENMRLTCRDFAGTGNHDANGHGTHCAGTLFGGEVDGVPIGVAPGISEALIGKILADDGRGRSTMLMQGLHWAALQRARVISLSLAFDFAGTVAELVAQGYPELLATSVALESHRDNLRMVETLLAALGASPDADGGAVVVAAAGNESGRQISPEFEVSVGAPASAAGVLPVGALGRGEAGLEVATFSNTRPALSAPGVGIVSAASGGGLRTLNGTSMACLHAAGIAALIWEAQAAFDAPMTAEAVADRLRRSATRSGLAPGNDGTMFGAGLVQAPFRKIHRAVPLHAQGRG
ncbi:S8 family serine peptidase [Salipiger sp.]|uniref:S8 family serine peptidase n=1 Tax=Salipiger sp. TaxID=2078585 RepID=UPI003A969882